MKTKGFLLLSNKSPVPVKQRQVWGYMKQEMAAEGKLCWAAVRPGEQGEGLIDGTYMDYWVKDIFSSDFKSKPRKHHVVAMEGQTYLTLGKKRS